MERDKLHWEEVRKTWQASVDQDRERQEKRANVRIRLLYVLGCSSIFICRILNISFDFFPLRLPAEKQQQIFDIQNSTCPNR